MPLDDCGRRAVASTTSSAEPYTACHRQSLAASDSGSSPEALINLRIARRIVRIDARCRPGSGGHRWQAARGSCHRRLRQVGPVAPDHGGHVPARDRHPRLLRGLLLGCRAPGLEGPRLHRLARRCRPDDEDLHPAQAGRGQRPDLRGADEDLHPTLRPTRAGVRGYLAVPARDVGKKTMAAYAPDGIVSSQQAKRTLRSFERSGSGASHLPRLARCSTSLSHAPNKGTRG